MKIDGRTISDDGQIELRGHELIQHRRHRAARTARVRHRGGAERATHLLKNSWSGLTPFKGQRYPIDDQLTLSQFWSEPHGHNPMAL